jgi:hypothetical protein
MTPPGSQYLSARAPWVPEIGYVPRSDAERQEALEEDLSARSLCSQQVKEIPAAARRKPLLCFISFSRGLLSHVARGEVRYSAQSGWDRLDLWNLTEFDPPIRISALTKRLGARRTSRARNTLKAGGNLPAKAFEQMMEALQRTDAASYKTANGLIDRSAPPAPPEPTAARMNWAYQRDAAVTVQEIAGIPRGQLWVAPQLDTESSPDAVSIFDDVGDMRAIEDVLVLRDLEGEPDWDLVKKHRYPAKTFENGDTKLTIVLANKLDLEKQLGVDLIYVNETLKSVVFVQYKMFKGVDGEEGYRPDSQLGEEIQRMDAAMAVLMKAAADESCDGYRFGIDPFFLKFCTRLLEHDQEGHVPGYYIPVSYWKRLVLDPRVKGPCNGIVVRPDNLGRYFTPTAFKDLVTRGWIGTTALAAEVVIPAIKAAMVGSRSIVLAVQSTVPEDGSEEPKPRLKAPPPPRYPGRKAPRIQI